MHVFKVITGVAAVATLVDVQVTPDASLKSMFVPSDPVAPAPTANHRCVKGEKAMALTAATLVIAALEDLVHPVTPLGSVVYPIEATPASPTPPATHHDRVLLPDVIYVLATIFGVTVATAETPPSNMKFLVP
jgi:hypothetical protein